MEKRSKNLMSDGVKKQIVQDISPQKKTNNRRSIRDIPIPKNGGVSKNTASHSKDVEVDSKTNNNRVDDILSQHPPIPPKRDVSKYVLWGIVLMSVVALVFAVSSLFSGATITITPKQQRVTLSDTFSAASEPSTADIPYQVVQISDTVSKIVESDSEEFVEEKASGQIVIFNTHSSASQKLIEQTRFQTPDNKIYRILEPVTVPGQSIVDGEEIPGQIEVTVYADEPGAEYNIGLTDFTIPGFEGDPRFDTFFARSKTPITGGFNGTKPIVNEDTEAQAEIELQELLQERLSNELSSRISSNLIVPDEGIFYLFEALPVTKDTEGSVEMVHKATLMAIALTTSDLARAVVGRTSVDSPLPVHIDNINDLLITLLNPTEFDIQNSAEARIEVSGDAHLVWLFDEEQVKSELAGEKKKDLSRILSSYESIEKARAVIRPFWKRTFPTVLSKIKLKTELD